MSLHCATPYDHSYYYQTFQYPDYQNFTSLPLVPKLQNKPVTSKKRKQKLDSNSILSSNKLITLPCQNDRNKKSKGLGTYYQWKPSQWIYQDESEKINNSMETAQEEQNVEGLGDEFFESILSVLEKEDKCKNINQTNIN